MLLISILLFSGNTSDQLNQKVADYFNSILNTYDKYEYEIISLPKDAVDIKILEDSNLTISGRTAHIPVFVTRRNKSVYKSFISVRLKLYKNVLVALAPIEKHTQLNYSQFETRLINITSIRGKPIGHKNLLNNLRSKSFVKKGTVMVEGFTEPVPLISAGDNIKAVASEGSVSVSTYAFARQDGWAGDIIKIKTIDNKYFKAKVVNSKIVNIIE